MRGLVKQLQKYDVEQLVITNNDTNKEKLVDRSNPKITIISLKIKKKIGSYYALLDGLSNILRQNDYDIINAHGYGSYGADLASALKTFRALRKPMVLSTQSIAGLKHAYLSLKSSFPLSKIERITRSSHLFHDFTLGWLEMRTFDKVIVFSNEEKHYLSKLGLKEDKTVHIPIAIDDVFFTKDLAVDRKYILYVGRIDRYKGIEVLLRALRALKAANSTLMCIIIGRDVGYKSNLELLVHEYDIADRVQIREQVSQQELVNLYSSALVTVLPSSSEGFPLTIAESMARGTPFISTPVGYVPELAKKTKAGMIIPIGDAESLTRALVCLLSDKKLHAEMSSNGRKFAENYRWETIAHRYFRLYCDVIEHKK